jgi:hypothetical protein
MNDSLRVQDQRDRARAGLLKLTTDLALLDKCPGCELNEDIDAGDNPCMFHMRRACWLAYALSPDWE